MQPINTDTAAAAAAAATAHRGQLQQQPAM